MLDMSEYSPLIFGKHGPHVCKSGAILTGDVVWGIVKGDQRVKHGYIIDGSEAQIGEFKLSEIKSVNPICSHGKYLIQCNIKDRFFDIIEDTVPAPCALEGRILMLDDGVTECDTDIYEVTGQRLKNALYRTQNRGQIMDVEYYKNGEITGREFVSVPDHGQRRWLIDDTTYLLYICGGTARIIVKPS